MSPQELIDRYLYAVGKRLPAKIRKETEQELRSWIDELLKERFGESTPSEAELIELLTQLGTPAELAESYTPDRFHHLIGPPYYRYYKTVLAIVLAASAFGITISFLLTGLASSDWYPLLGKLFADLAVGMLAATGAVTLVFALFERRGERLEAFTPGYEIASLPPIPKENKQIPRYEPLIGIGISLLLLGIFVFFPDNLFVYIQNGQRFPVFSREVLQAHRFLLCLIFLIGIPAELLKWIDGRYTLRLAVTVLIGNLADGLLTAYFLRLPGLINPDFQQALEALIRKQGSFSPALEMLFQNWDLFLIAIVSIGLTVDAGVTLFRALRAPQLKEV